LYSIVFLGLFYWQFIYIYGLTISHFTEERLFILYGYLFVYLFGVLILTISFINMLHSFLIKQKSFVIITTLTLLIFYGVSFNEFYHIISFFIKYPLSSSAIMGVVFFIILSLIYTLYSMIILIFKKDMPLSSIVIFLGLGTAYSVGFIHYYCKALW
jgi:hypothetical protein